MGSTPGSGRPPREGNGNTFHHSFLGKKFHGQKSLAGYGPEGLKTVRHDLVSKQNKAKKEKPLSLFRDDIIIDGENLMKFSKRATGNDKRIQRSCRIRDQYTKLNCISTY